MNWRRGGRDDGEAGESLIEVLVTVVILGLTVVAILAGLATAISASTYHRRQANGDVVAKDYAEALRLTVSQLTSDTWCQTTVGGTGYSAPSYTAPAGWSGTVTATLGSCPTKLSASANTPQFQTATITAKSSDGYDTETQKIVLAPNWCYLSPSSGSASC